MIVGMNPYLVLNGNGQQAVKFYEDVLGAKVESVQTFGDMPAHPDHPVPDEAKDRVLHAHLKVANADLMISDTFPGQPYDAGSHVNLSIGTNNPETTKVIFDKLSENGYVIMPLQETFWSPLYGQVKDQFDVSWQISTNIEQ